MRLFFALSPRLNAAFAATLKFDPTTISTNVGETFTLDIVADAEEKEILGVDALIEYDPAICEIESITDGDFLEIGIKEFTQPGKIYIAGVVSSPGESVTGEGVLASVQCKAKAAGTTTFTYTCETGETNESNISEKSTDAPDLIQCALNGEAVVTVGGSTKPKTSTGSAKTPSELPRTGVVEDFLLYGIIGLGFMLVGAGAKSMLRI
ncbi:MAG: Cohesin domain protein [Microgenomates bacterium OLB23]|nr:MAG: Cohesin domain protein [Microgenomates bacterium OLB23]